MVLVKAVKLGVYRSYTTGEPLKQLEAGISYNADEIFILYGDGDRELEDTDPRLFRFVQRDITPEDRAAHLEPIAEPRGGYIGWLFGGNFAYSSEPTARALIGSCYAVPIYDRQVRISEYDKFGMSEVQKGSSNMNRPEDTGAA